MASFLQRIAKKMSLFSSDIGIDLGTANVLVYEEGRGIVLREPSVVAVDKNTGKVLQVGAAARNMLGRTPGNVVAVRPLRDGVISDYEMTEKMLEQFLKKISKFSLIKPRVIVSVPSGVPTSMCERFDASMARLAATALRSMQGICTRPQIGSQVRPS